MHTPRRDPVPDPLQPFTAATRAWFEGAFPAPTPVQDLGWPVIAGGGNALCLAPTGSGKTLAAFLWGIDRCARGWGSGGEGVGAADDGAVEDGAAVADDIMGGPTQDSNGRSARERTGVPVATTDDTPTRGVRVLYISPLKALAYDVERNLRAPLTGIERAAARLGEELSPVTIGVRTGDTSQTDRRRHRTHPPEIFVTTPESLYLILGSQAREILTTVETVIIDEVHALAPTKRGAHLALSLERLSMITRRDPQRIGLSATAEPIDELARFLGGDRPVEIVDARQAPLIDLQVVVPVTDLAAPERPTPLPGLGTKAEPPKPASTTDDNGTPFASPRLGGPEATASEPADAPRPDPDTSPTTATTPTPPALSKEATQVILPSGPLLGAVIASEQRDPTPGVWPALYRALLETIFAHRTTIIFVNSRGSCERVATRLNDLARAAILVAEEHGADPEAFPEDEQPAVDALDPEALARVPDVVRPHHGSIAQARRKDTEEQLKRGEIRAIVATSSLELGIDMATVDHVVLVESPGSVASGLQRIGRAGHGVGEVSRGTLLPKHRGDLLEAAVVSSRMLEGAIEPVAMPKNPLDVLAQQIVAQVAVAPQQLDDLERTFRRAANFRTLTRELLVAVLDMLAGRYPSHEFAELKPRIVWDRDTDTLTARSGAGRVAITSGGTIPDRGLYTVHLFQGHLSKDETTGPGALPPNGTPSAPPQPGGPSTTASGRAPGGRAPGPKSPGPKSSGPRAPAPRSPGPKSPGLRVGELDEEMVFETRIGHVITLGASSWRVVGITRDQVLVVPAPGEPGRLSFWRGDGPGRPIELGRALGAFLRDLEPKSRTEIEQHVAAHTPLDPKAARNLATYLTEQREATGALPTDRTITIERFPDELGDPRIAILTPFGARVHAPWAMAIEHRLGTRAGFEVQTLWSDDGILLRFVDVDELPPRDVLIPDPEEIEDQILEQVGRSALFAAHFRENAARALLLPRRRPGSRTPLWAQRLKSQRLLGVAQQYPAFPIVLETYRSCLQDVFDLPSLVELLRDIRSRKVTIEEVETAGPSPFARSLVFDFTASAIYEGDAPLAERRAQALTLDRGLLKELLGTEELRELLDREVIETVESELQRTAENYQARNADDLHDLLRTLGDLTEEEIAHRTHPKDENETPRTLLGQLATQKRAHEVRIAGEPRWIAAEDLGLVRDALGVAPPTGAPDAYLEPVEHPVRVLLRRYARTHTPFTKAQPAQRYAIAEDTIEQELETLTRNDQLLRGGFLPGGHDTAYCDTEYCDPGVLRRIKSKTLAHLRNQVAPVEGVVYQRFLVDWHHLENPNRGQRALDRAIEQLEGFSLSWKDWEEVVLPGRVEDYTPKLLDEKLARGELVWIGDAPLGKDDGKVSLYRRERIPLLRDRTNPEQELEEDSKERALYDLLKQRGALFLHELKQLLPNVTDHELRDSLWTLVWKGLITNDNAEPLRNIAVRPSRKSRGRRRGLTGTHPRYDGGRWSPTENLYFGTHEDTEKLHARATTLLERYGVVARPMLKQEPWKGGFAAFYPVLKAMEEAGKIRRGYFVEGLGGAQFATPGAVDRLRATRQEPNSNEPNKKRPAVALATQDPALAYGLILEWPKPNAETPQLRRAAGARTVLTAGNPQLYWSVGANALLTWIDSDTPELVGRDLVDALERANRSGVHRFDTIDGVLVWDAPSWSVLESGGLIADHRGARIRS